MSASIWSHPQYDGTQEELEVGKTAKRYCQWCLTLFEVHADWVKGGHTLVCSDECNLWSNIRSMYDPRCIRVEDLTPERLNVLLGERGLALGGAGPAVPS